ncbi:MAG: STAS domain-containing protein [Chitinophagaceae bacterium]|nr:MAG: STAS domain-containing protein [Chitinophagaceae bacterium]
MNFKSDTKDKFHVISLTEPLLSADMAAKMSDSLLDYLQFDVKNIILNLKELQQIDMSSFLFISKLQQIFYSNNASFVICELQKTVKDYLDSIHALDTLNYTPTETEAWDIVQMEEIERELLKDE